MDHSSIAVQRQDQDGEKKKIGDDIHQDQSSIPPPTSSSQSSSPIPAIKLKKQNASGWTCSSSSNKPVSKLRRLSRVKLKLRSWMAEPLVVKEGDASLRLATDLPRFNWLELKLNQKQDGPLPQNEIDCRTSSTNHNNNNNSNNNNLSSVPLKVRILEKTSYAARIAESLSKVHEVPMSQTDRQIHSSDLAQQQDKSTTDAQNQASESTTTSCTSRWPLKKRVIRSTESNQVSPTVSPVISPVNSPVNRPVSSSQSLPSTTMSTTISTTAETILNSPQSSAPDPLIKEAQPSPPAQRGPVIIRNVLPPTPPSSSAPPELTAVDDQDKPLDLSRRCITKPLAQPTILLNETLFKLPAMARREDKAEVEIIAMTTRISPVRPSVVGFQQTLRQRFAHHHPADIRRVQRNEREAIVAKTVRDSREYATSIQRIPPVHPSEKSFPDWSSSHRRTNNHSATGFRPYAEHARGRVVPTTSPVVTPMSSHRPFVLPPLRPLPHHWNSLVAQQQQHQQQRNVVIRPEVHLHPIVAGINGQVTNGFVNGPRLFHPQQVTPATTKKQPPTATNSTSLASHSMTTTLPSDWSLRSCVVCSRRADFRCAGCHGNAYCSARLAHA